jgi:meso-butanediol dehydrogenase / (S,S)-butanediol dehydrogenase / diacetyl reductase
MDFGGKVAVVTGGGSGIGRATCEVLAHYGAKIMVLDIDEKAGQETVQKLTAADKTGAFQRVDVTQWPSVQDAFRATREQLGRVDALVNCAGILTYASIEDLEPADWKRVVDVNLTGAFYVTKAAFQTMGSEGGGIVHIASRMALRVKEGHGAYAAAKAGVMQLARMAALEGAPRKIRVNCICPGMTDTAMNWIAYGAQAFEGWKALCPQKRVGQPEEIAEVIAFLLSDKASYITGAVLPIDGGRTLL